MAKVLALAVICGLCLLANGTPEGALQSDSQPSILANSRTGQGNASEPTQNIPQNDTTTSPLPQFFDDITNSSIINAKPVLYFNEPDVSESNESDSDRPDSDFSDLEENLESNYNSASKNGDNHGNPVATQNSSYIKKAVGTGGNNFNNSSTWDKSQFDQWLRDRKTTTLRPRVESNHFASIGGKPVTGFKFNDYPRWPQVSGSMVGLLVASPPRWMESPSEDIGTRVGTGETNDNTKSQENNSKESERLPWQVSVFIKRVEPYLRVCGGSMVTSVAVVSAAHCFWREGEGLLPASLFAVGAGEVLRYRIDDYGSYRQQNDVQTIKVPPRFGGAAGNYMGDIAVVLLTRPFYDSKGMRPICVSFDRGLEQRQLTAGNLATTLGVGMLKEKGLTVLQTLKVPFIEAEECRQILDQETLQYFTADKICAGFKPGASPALGKICYRDAGAGLAFFLGDERDHARGIAVPFLWGVASLASACDAGAATLYTHVREHRALLEDYVGEGECWKYYPQLGALLEGKDPASSLAGAQFVCNCYC